MNITIDGAMKMLRVSGFTCITDSPHKKVFRKTVSGGFEVTVQLIDDSDPSEFDLDWIMRVNNLSHESRLDSLDDRQFAERLAIDIGLSFLRRESD